jgi:HSP20 family protein
MAIRKGKENRIAVRPSDKKNEVTNLRPADLWTEMDRMFDNFRTNFDDLFWPWSQRQAPSIVNQQRTPPMDVADHGNHYEMRIEMPGVQKDDINIEVTSNTIEISAQYEQNTEDNDKNWIRKERSSMSYYRALEFPEELSTDDVDAELKDGLLTLTLPKIEPKPEHKPKKVKIK